MIIKYSGWFAFLFLSCACYFDVSGVTYSGRTEDGSDVDVGSVARNRASRPWYPGLDDHGSSNQTVPHITGYRTDTVYYADEHRSI